MTSPISFDKDDLVATIAANLDEVRNRIVDAGRRVDDVRIVAITKTHPVTYVAAAAACGLRTAGENYVEELLAKQELVAPELVEWEFVGALQTNKIARLVSKVQRIATVHREKEIQAIARRAPGMTVYVQVDFTGESRRNGAAPALVANLVAASRDAGLNVQGLMTVAAPEPGLAREAFAQTSALADRLALPVRSMGMSQDYELALIEGSTEIRLGTALFGARNRL